MVNSLNNNSIIKFKSTDKVGQVITKEMISKWDGNVILDAGTATGKTTFILTVLSEYCLERNKKILFVCNRSVLAEEVEMKIKKMNITNVKVITYQSIEQKLRYGHDITLEYDYIALDEFHHMLEIYNHYTDLSYQYFINHPSQKIFMSATCGNLFRQLVDDGIVNKNQYYHIPKDYSYVDNITFYNRKTAHIDIIKNKLENTTDKIIYFTQSIEDAINTYKTFEEHSSTFFCSKYTSNNKAKEILDVNDGKVANETFHGRLLIATKALDVGINLFDKEIKHIVINMFDHNSMIQCIGRKRIIDESDTCSFYIRSWNKRELNVYRDTEILKQMNMFKTNREKFNKEYLSNREYHNKYIWFDNGKKKYRLNELAYLNLQSKDKSLDIMTNIKWINNEGLEIKGLGYKWFTLRRLGIDNFDSRIKSYEDDIERMEKQSDLNTYLNSVIGNVMLTSPDRKELIEMIDVRDGNSNRLLKSINTLNAVIHERNLDYIIKQFETSRIVNGKKKKYKSAWKIMRLSDN